MFLFGLLFAAIYVAVAWAWLCYVSGGKRM